MFGAAAMGLSSFCVVTNALRLNFVKPYEAKKDKSVKNPVKGNLIKTELAQIPETGVLKDAQTGSKATLKEKTMKISVKGMMCSHCEMHVKKALEALDGITSATASHESGTVTIETSKEISEDAIKAAVTDAGYEYCGKC